MQAQKISKELYSVKLNDGVTSHSAAWTGQAQKLLDEALLKILADTHKQFHQRRLDLLSKRGEIQKRYDQGVLPMYCENPFKPHQDSEWRVAQIPLDLLQRRVEITGPVNSKKMVINMLNPNSEGVRADMAMLDFEDSMKPSWQNVLDGVENVKSVAEGELQFFDKKKNKLYQLKHDDHAKMMIRIRGLHLIESNLRIDDEDLSAGLFDFVASMYHTAKKQLEAGLTPKFYVPKIEQHTEAKFWNDVFVFVQNRLGMEKGTIRATFLIETLNAAFQIEEILYELRDHICALNVGRWDKIFSDIKVLREHSDCIMADRASIDMSKVWMKNYAKRLIKLCHQRGAMAIGGMSAFTPGKDPEQVQQQTNKVIADKQNEFQLGHDGCWVSHPYFIKPALDQFPKTNQLDVQLKDFPKYPNLIPISMGMKTLNGLRTNVRVGIAYLKGWNDDIGCVSWDGLMEDLATLEISRAQTWQWLHHEVELQGGEIVTKDLVEMIFDQELEQILTELKTHNKEIKETELNTFIKAKKDAMKLFTEDSFRDFLATRSELAK